MEIKKDNRDEIIKICDELDKEKKHTRYNYNPIQSAKNSLENYINDNYDNYLQLKAELDIHLKFNENTFTNLAFIFSFFSLISTLVMNIFNIWNILKCNNSVNEIGNNVIIVNLFFLILILVLTSSIYCNYNKNTKREKWLSYIKYALESIEQNFKSKKDETKPISLN